MVCQRSLGSQDTPEDQWPTKSTSQRKPLRIRVNLRLPVRNLHTSEDRLADRRQSRPEWHTSILPKGFCSSFIFANNLVHWLQNLLVEGGRVGWACYSIASLVFSRETSAGSCALSPGGSACLSTPSVLLAIATAAITSCHLVLGWICCCCRATSRENDDYSH